MMGKFLRREQYSRLTQMLGVLNGSWDRDFKGAWQMTCPGTNPVPERIHRLGATNYYFTFPTMPFILNILFYGFLMLLPLFLFLVSYYRNQSVARRSTVVDDAR